MRCRRKNLSKAPVPLRGLGNVLMIASQTMPRRKLILDVDTGTDDAVAIMLAALHPDLELVACTTVNGNREVEHTTDNTLRTLDHIGRGDIPVHAGLSRPIARLDFPIPRGQRDPGVHFLEMPLAPAR